MLRGKCVCVAGGRGGGGGQETAGGQVRTQT